MTPERLWVFVCYRVDNRMFFVVAHDPRFRPASEMDIALQADAELGLGDSPRFDELVLRYGIKAFARHCLFMSTDRAAIDQMHALAIRANHEMGADVLNAEPGDASYSETINWKDFSHVR